MIFHFYWTVLSVLLLTQMREASQDLHHTPVDNQAHYAPLPFVFQYQGKAASGWVCCADAPSAACIKSQRAQDCPACARCLPLLSSPRQKPYRAPSPSDSNNYFRGQPKCTELCHFEGSGPQGQPSGPSSSELNHEDPDGSQEQVQLQNRGRPNSPIRPPPKPAWPGPPLPPRNQPPPPPPPRPPRPPRGGGNGK